MRQPGPRGISGRQRIRPIPEGGQQHKGPRLLVFSSRPAISWTDKKGQFQYSKLFEELNAVRGRHEDLHLLLLVEGVGARGAKR
jgi:hypothetical protein